MTQVIWTREFLLAQGYNLGPAVVKQDNQSTMVLANKGRSTSSKTRHIGIRYFWVNDRIVSGDVVLEYLATEDMAADILTKPLQGILNSASELKNITISHDGGAVREVDIQ
jgi:hypothetical protein